MDISKLDDISKFLAQFNVEYDFHFIDLETNKNFRSGMPINFPFASCYKLGILGSILENPAIASDLDKKIELNDSKVSKLASGVLQTLDLPVTLSIRNLLKIMMSQSDGTAADFLSNFVGFEKVQSYISNNTRSSRLTHNIEGLISKLVTEAKKISSGDQITRSDYLTVLKATTSNEDYTNALDLTLLLKKLAGSGPTHLQFLKQNQANPRTAMYCPSDVQIYGKTGTLGYWASVNDCGIVCRDGSTRALFGLTTLGWKEPRYIIENCFGEIGRIMCSLYSTAQYSPAYGP